jgi:hypothetical protein
MDQNRPINSIKQAPVIAGVSLVLGLLFNYLFFDKSLGINFVIYVILILTGLFFILKHLDKTKSFSKQAKLLLLPLAFFSTMVFIRTSELLTFMNVVGSFLLLLLIAETSFRSVLKNFLISDYFKIFLLPLKFIRPLFETLPNIFRFKKVPSQVIRGIIITIPVLAIFLALLSSADLIFNKFVTDLFSFDIAPDLAPRVILILIATFLLIGAYAYIISKREEYINQPALQSIRKPFVLGHIETSILLGSVNIVFFSFIIIQLAYLFGGMGSVVSQGFTYAEYARKGFFELIAVAILTLIILLATERLIAKKDIQNPEHSLVFKVLSTALVVQVVLIMISSFKRLYLYEQVYGFTILRLYSHAFIILLAVIFGLLVYKIFKDYRENTFALRVFVAIILFVVSMNILNPDAFIARQNVKQFMALDKIDAYYVSDLSDDAIPEAIKILDIPSSNTEAKKVFGHSMYLKLQSFRDKESDSSWQSFNVSHFKAKKILESRARELEAI